MAHYADTNIQLYIQLRDKGYTREEINTVRQGYELAIRLFAGKFQASGRPYLSHVVRTASILGSLNAPFPVVAAGLIHNVYITGDFGYRRRNMLTAKRRLIRKTLGDEVEQLISRFAVTKWDKWAFPLIRDELESSDQVYRNIVLLYLADHLEHNLDYGILHNAKKRDKWLSGKNLPIVIEIAQKLGYPTLAKDLNWVFQENARVGKTFEGCGHSRLNSLSCMIPLSCRKRLSIVVYEALIKLEKRLRHRVARKPHS